MKIGIGLTDYKIRSEKIYKFTLLAFGALLSAIVAAEVFLDLRATSIEIIVPFMAALFTTIAFALRFPNSKLVKTLFVTLLFAMIEVHFLYQPVIFHTIIFWFPFVPLLSLIIAGTLSSVIWIGILLVTLVFNSFYLNLTVGNSYTIEIFNIPVLVSAIIFTVAISTNSFILYHLLGKAYFTADQKNRELEEVKEKIDGKKNLLEQYMRQFIQFSKNESNFNNGSANLFKAICKTTASTFSINRVSIWLFDQDDASLLRHYLYEADNETDEIIQLDRTDFPNYFAALKTQPFIMAADAQTHEFTKEFTEDYLKPLDIYSMLDCPITVNRQPIGVICCENQHAIKNWNLEDTLFLQSFADFIAMNYKNQRIEELMAELRQTNKELRSKNKEIEVMNNALDTTVRKRTKALKTQKAQLTEYSFINSHLLRAPLTRILGLSQHLLDEAECSKDTELFGALIESSEELDTIIRKINDVLYAGNGLTREDLISIENDLKADKKEES